MNLFEAAYLDNLSDVPFHLRGQVKRARDARHYADITMPRVGDLVSVRYGPHPGMPAVVTYVNAPTVRFTYPDGIEFTSGVMGVKLCK